MQHSPSFSVWNTAPTPSRIQRKHGGYIPDSAAHPAKMLPAIAAHAIRTYSSPGDLVLDPMCGIGTTLVEAQYQGRHALGIEYEPRWAHIAARNTAKAAREGASEEAEVYRGDVYQGDARQATRHIPTHHHGGVALVVTSPPYGRSAHGHVRSTGESGQPGIAKRHFRYSHDPTNLAHTPTDDLLVAFTDILTECRKLLRPGGTVVIATRPWRRNGELIDLPTATLTAGRTAGLTPTERNAALLAGIRNSQLILRPSFFQQHNLRQARRHGAPLHLIAHEDIFVFTAPAAPHKPIDSDLGRGSQAGVRARCAEVVRGTA